MRKKHDYAALLKYMRMLDNGYSIHYIHKKFGINSEQLSRTRELYLLNGKSSLQQKVRFEATPELKYHIISDIIKNHLPLREASLKFEVSIVRLGVWLKIAKEQGIDALLTTKKRGRPPGMGRPRKKKPEEMTELERLRRENHLLKLELEIRKKAQALVEERKARLRAIGRGQSEN